MRLVTEEELRSLHRRFRYLDKDSSGGISLEEFQSIPDLEHNPLVQRVVSTFDEDANEEVEFDELVHSLTVFTQGNVEEKYRFTFKLYDVNNDGYISNGDLFRVLKAMVGNNLTDVQLQQLVDRTIMQGDLDRDGKLSYDEFVAMVEDTELAAKMCISLQEMTNPEY